MRNAIGLSFVTGGLIYNNLVISAGSDGIDIQASHDITVSHNSCINGNPGDGVHPDCVQLYSAQGYPVTSNIMVSDNLAFGPTQGFTKFASGGIATNVSFLRNLVESTYPQGIACYDCYDSNISDNLVITLASAQFQTNINVVGGANNIVSGNVLQNPGPAKPYRPAFGTIWHNAGVTPWATTFSGTVADPSTWLSMISGFGLLGAAMRHRRMRAILV